jgi:hypothetical protein
MEEWNMGRMEYWNIGTLEYWVRRAGFTHHSIIPIFHHSIGPDSIIPIFQSLE